MLTVLCVTGFHNRILQINRVNFIGLEWALLRLHLIILYGGEGCVHTTHTHTRALATSL